MVIGKQIFMVAGSNPRWSKDVDILSISAGVSYVTLSSGGVNPCPV